MKMKMATLCLKEIYAQFVETNDLVKHNIYHELKLTIMDLDLQITRKHPVINCQNGDSKKVNWRIFLNPKTEYWM